MDRTACTEPQCLYSTAIPLLPLWTVRPVQSLSACKSVHFTFLFLPQICYHIQIFIYVEFRCVPYTDKRHTWV